jgi:hypothetical protein
MPPKKPTERGQQCCLCRGANYYSKFCLHKQRGRRGQCFQDLPMFRFLFADTHAAEEAHRAGTAVLSM